MRADREIVLCSSRENLRGFSGAERSAIAEHIHELGKFALGDCRNHFTANQIDILPRASAILRWDDVRPEKRGNDRSWPLAGRRADRFERLQLQTQG